MPSPSAEPTRLHGFSFLFGRYNFTSLPALAALTRSLIAMNQTRRATSQQSRGDKHVVAYLCEAEPRNAQQVPQWFQAFLLSCRDPMTILLLGLPNTKVPRYASRVLLTPRNNQRLHSHLNVSDLGQEHPHIIDTPSVFPVARL